MSSKKKAAIVEEVKVVETVEQPVVETEITQPEVELPAGLNQEANLIADIVADRIVTKVLEKLEALKAAPKEATESKPRQNKRPYIEMVTQLLEAGTHDRKEIVKLVTDTWKEVRKGGVETFLTDLKNPKYSYFKERPVGTTADGKLIFLDKIPTDTQIQAMVDVALETPVITEKPAASE